MRNMLYVDENHYDQSYFECCFSSFAVHPQLARIEGQRIAVRLTDRALWLALCLYARQRSGTLFPLAVDTPLDACRRRAERSGCRWLIFGDGSEALDALQAIGSPESDATGEAALIQTSSGTTGEPKFIERSWSSIATEVEAYVRHFD
ncbi:MAG TPA: hypothetical protein VLC09_17150, partial [Polyangiaceae bacterium]|nr:hypothetical protein [Polyangiaceae bacterium]